MDIVPTQCLGSGSFRARHAACAGAFTVFLHLTIEGDPLCLNFGTKIN